MIEQMPTRAALALDGQLNYSMVTKRDKVDLMSAVRREEHALSDFFYCEAKTRDNQCGYCRACWDTSIPVIVYPYH